MKTLFKSFLEKNKSDDMLVLMYHLDTIQKEIGVNNTDNEEGRYFDYECNGNVITLSYGFSGYEEHSNNELVITFDKNKITLTGHYDGHSVMGNGDGDYGGELNDTFENVDELIKWLDLKNV